MNAPEVTKKAELYTRYPASNVAIYNGATFAHFIIGGIGIALGFSFLWFGYIIGILYMAFAFIQMYILMPIMVCPNCVYYGMKDARCVSANNKLSEKLARKGNMKDFGNRAVGICSHNKMYMGSLFFPVFALIIALIFDFSPLILLVFIIVLLLLLLRMFVIFPRVACVHCRAKRMCPNAKAMGLADG